MNYIEIAKQNLHDEEKLDNLIEAMANDESITDKEYSANYEEIMKLYKMEGV